MNKVMPEDLKTFEASISDMVHAYAHEHGPTIRRLFDVSHEAHVVYVTYCSFLGHTLDVLQRIIGRERALEMARQVLDQVTVIEQTVAEAAKTGITLDPYAVSAVVVGQDPA